MTTVQRPCQECGTPFTPRRLGRPQLYCRPACGTKVHNRANAQRPCTVDGCTSLRYQGRALCSTHVMRKHRNGDVHADRSRTGRTWDHSHGYRVRTIAGHPLADAHGAVYVHRLVLFDHIGPGTHPCHWCHNPVTWGIDLQVDHINAKRDDNRIANLVPSCHGCNTRRANLRRWRPPQGELQPDVVDVVKVNS